MTIRNKRIVAWRGSRVNQYGIVIRVDGVYHCYILWDDGTETHYETAAIMVVK